MASTISIHVGGTGIRLGQRLWDVIFADHGVSASGSVTGQSVGSGSGFLAKTGTRFVPRAIVADSDTDAIGALSSWSHRSLLKPDNIVFGSASCANNFATGYLHRTSLRDDVLTRVNATVASVSDDNPTFLLTHSLAGGTGGGLTAALVQELRSQHPGSTIVCCGVLRDKSLSSIAVAPYNEVFALDKIHQFADLVVVLDNAALTASVTAKFGQVASNYTGHNQLAARALGLLTSANRLPVRESLGFRQLARTLTPFTDLKLVGLAMGTWGSSASSDLVAGLQTGHNRISGIRVSGNKLLSPMFITSKRRKLSATEFRSDSRLRIPSWYPPAVPVVETRSTDASSLLVENNTGVHHRLTALVTEFDRMFKRKAFLHYYKGKGLSELMMAQARKNVFDLAKGFKDAG